MSYKKVVVLTAILFCLGIVLGLFSTSSFVDDSPLLSQQVEEIGKLAGMLTPFSISTCVLIFLKNVLAVSISFLFAPFLCLLPILALLLNGWLVAFLCAPLIREGSLALVLAALVPHGIFEIPAFILGEAAALSFGGATMATLLKKGGKNTLGLSFRKNLKYLLIAVLLLAPAAIVETYITPLAIGLCR